MDRGYGRPGQALEATMNGPSVREMTDGELSAIAGAAKPVEADNPTASF
jgi:hypothetical protein